MGSYFVDMGNEEVAYQTADALVGAVSNVAAISDANDASYFEETETVTNFLFIQFSNSASATSALPAGAVITGVRAWYRGSNTFNVIDQTDFDRPSWYLNVINRQGTAYTDPLFGVWTLARQNESDGVIRDKVGPIATQAYAASVVSMHEAMVGSAGSGLPASQLKVYCNAYISTPSGTQTGKSAKWIRCRLEVLYNDRPVTAVTAPAGNQPASRPNVAWTYTDADADAQTHYQVRVFDAATYGAGGFDPATATPTWDSGKTAGFGTSAQIGTALTNGTTYKAYVRAWHADVAAVEMVSAWAAGAAFTIVVDPPATPAVTATLDTTLAAINVTVQGRDNELTFNQSSLETDTTGWVAGASTTMTRTTAAGTFLHGVAGLSLQRITSIGDAAAATLGGATGVPVTVGQTYIALASLKAAATLRSCRLDIAWYTAAGAFISTTAGTPTNDAVGSWTQITCSGVAPPTAAFAQVGVTVINCAINEIHYVDQISIAPGSSTTWTRGGLVNTNQRFTVERQAGAGAWTPIRVTDLAGTDPPTGQIVPVSDSEFPHAQLVRYRARVTSLADGTSTVVSANSASSTPDLTMPLSSGWWLKDPALASNNLQIRVSAPPQWRLRKAMGADFSIDSDYFVVSHSGLKGNEIGIQITTLSAAEDAKLQALLRRSTLLLVDPLGRSWYVEPGDAEYELLVAAPTGSESTPLRYSHTYGVSLLEVGP